MDFQRILIMNALQNSRPAKVHFKNRCKVKMMKEFQTIRNINVVPSTEDINFGFLVKLR